MLTRSVRCPFTAHVNGDVIARQNVDDRDLYRDKPESQSVSTDSWIVGGRVKLQSWLII